MKIAIATSGKTLDAPLATHFGRAEYFIIFDTITAEWDVYRNRALKARDNIGVRAAQFLINHDVQIVISGDFGPRVTKALAMAGIKTYSAIPTAGKVLSDYRKGKLSEVLPSAEAEIDPQKAVSNATWGGY